MRKLRFPFASAAIALALVGCHRNATVDANNDTMTDTNGAVTNMDTGNTMTPASADTSFLSEAIKGDNSEVAIGQLAEQQGSSAKVKSFGKALVADHGAHQAKLAAMATAARLTVPTGPSDEGQQNLDKLKGLTGAAFDSAFKQAMIADHEKDIAKYEEQAKGSDGKIAAMAKQTLPTLRNHLAAAKAL